jgi:choline dehydrogenase-like flavoprotein
MGVVVREPKINAKDLATTVTEKEDAERHNAALETPPVHLGIFGLILPWNSGLELKLSALIYPKAGVFIAISRDHAVESNRVTIDKEGNPVIHYQVPYEDQKQLLKALETNIRMLYSVGAKFIFLGHTKVGWFARSTPPASGSTSSDAAAGATEPELEKYISQVWQHGIVPNEMSIFSAHQMSSCRMASTPQDGPTSPSGELYECRNLFIADGSVLPTSLGINPMITIEAFSHMISKNVIKKLQKMK